MAPPTFGRRRGVALSLVPRVPLGVFRFGDQGLGFPDFLVGEFFKGLDGNRRLHRFSEGAKEFKASGLRSMGLGSRVYVKALGVAMCRA